MFQIALDSPATGKLQINDQLVMVSHAAFIAGATLSLQKVQDTPLISPDITAHRALEIVHEQLDARQHDSIKVSKAAMPTRHANRRSSLQLGPGPRATWRRGNKSCGSPAYALSTWRRPAATRCRVDAARVC